MIITPFFWTLLYSKIPRKSWFLGNFGEAIDHCLPLICLIIEGVFCNRLVFLRRQFPLIFFVATIYSCLNFWYTKNYRPVYPVLTWEGWSGFFVPVATLAVSLLIFFTLEYLTIRRLKNTKNEQIIDVLKGNKTKIEQ